MADKPVKLVANRPQIYRGRFVRVGESFTTSESDAADLVAIKYASLDTRPDYKQKTLTAEVTVPGADDDQQPLKSERYMRRDMRAKDQ